MRIKDERFQVEEKRRISLDLKELLAQPSDQIARPCPGCRFTFADDKSITSTRHCSPLCPYVARQMSSEPEEFPIEDKVVPLVYAFYTMRVMMPCWSCEGHLNEQYKVVKLPKVWFYSTSCFYPKMLAQLLGQLRGNHRLSVPWDVRILPFSQSMFSITYSLEPDVKGDEPLNLSRMQKDMNVIAKSMRHDLLSMAKHYLRRAKRGGSENHSPIIH